MILKYEKRPAQGTEEVPSATSGPTVCVIDGIDRYETGVFKEKEVTPGQYQYEMYITYHLEKDDEQYSRSVTIPHGCFAFIMNNDGKTIERIR